MRHTHRVSIEFVVIDSGSFDGCGEMLAKQFPTVRFIQSPSNLGFAAANNRAFEASTGDYLLFLNPDTELVQPAIDNLCSAARALKDAGVLGCRLLNSDGTLQSSCIQPIPTLANQAFGAEFLMRTFRKTGLWGAAALDGRADDPQEVEGVSGACLMIRRSTFQDIGRFNEDYFMYAEDVDLAYRAKKAGYRNYYIPSASVVHHGGSSSNQAASAFAAVMMREAIWRFLRKTRGTAYALSYRVTTLAAALVRLSLIGLAWISGRRTTATRASLDKWFAILRWTVNRDDIVTRYYGRPEVQ
jgi:GT2 family glycosyltransferase